MIEYETSGQFSQPPKFRNFIRPTAILLEISTDYIAPQHATEYSGPVQKCS
jgi:hypothetical protein